MKSRQAITVTQAIERIMEDTNHLGTEYISIDNCDGRILAEDIIADHDVPPFDRSPYDGFAIRAEDTIGASRGNPVQLKVVEEIGAGKLAKRSVGKGEAIRIMTGTQMPPQADAVVMLENVQETIQAGIPFISVPNEYQSGQNLSKQGEETEKGTVQVQRGEVINPGTKAVLATFGYANVLVNRKPVVGIFATGTELLDVGDEMVPGKIRNSNASMIVSLVRKTGAIPRYMGKLDDEFDECFTAIQKALEKVDVLITTGGVSVGDYDYLPVIYEKLGAEICFNKVNMRPGSVTTVAKWKGKKLFGLSGNPSACFVGFFLYTRPVLKTMLGANQPFMKRAKAILKQDFPKENPVTRFVRGHVDIEGATLTVRSAGLDKSNAVTPLVQTDALIMFSAGTSGFKKGMETDILCLDRESEKW